MPRKQPRTSTLSRCVACDHLRIAHSSIGKSNARRRCQESGCECRAYRGTVTAATRRRRAELDGPPPAQLTFLDVEEGQ